MIDGVFCEHCGVGIAVDDRFCGECGARQGIVEATGDREQSLSADPGKGIQGATDVDRPMVSATPASLDDHPPEKSSLGFWDAAGIAMELLVRGVYIVACAGIAVLAFQHEEPLIGAGAIAYGLYILGGGKWFVY